MSSKTKRTRGSIKETNQRYFLGVLCSLCEQPLSIRLGYCFDILFKKWKNENGNVVRK